MAKASVVTNEQAEVDRWVLEPMYWARRFSGKDFDPWSGQEALWAAYARLLNAKLKRLERVPMTPEEEADAQKMGISVMAGQGLGKERTISAMGLHYLLCLQAYAPKVVCTAPAGTTLHSTLWPEFGKVMAQSETFSALFEKQSRRIYLKSDKRRGEFSYIEPRTIQQNSNPDEQGVVLAGIHAIGVLYLVTEASDVPPAVFKPLEGGLTDPLSMIILIFNPTRMDGFAADSHGRNRQDWVCLNWSGRTLKAEKEATPERFSWFNAQAQDVLDRKFGKDSDFVRVRVDGLPPRKSSDSLIHFDAVMASRDRVNVRLTNDPLCVFIDVGGEGDDPSCVTALRGPDVIWQHLYKRKEPTELAELVATRLSEELSNLPDGAQYAVGVDSIGLGRGVYSNLLLIHQIRNLYKLDVSESPLAATRFHRMRDQVLWELREGFIDQRAIVLGSEWDHEDWDELLGELTTIKWAEVSGKIKVQGKGGSSGIPGVKPLLKSPNRLDSLAGAWWLYQHYCSRMPDEPRFRRRRMQRRPVRSWKAA